MRRRLQFVCLLLCLAFVISTTGMQAIAHFDDELAVITLGADHASLPPCHQTKKDGNNEGHNRGCCSNFACCLGLATTEVLPGPTRRPPMPKMEQGHTVRSIASSPLEPPPKSV